MERGGWRLHAVRRDTRPKHRRSPSSCVPPALPLLAPATVAAPNPPSQHHRQDKVGGPLGLAAPAPLVNAAAPDAVKLLLLPLVLLSLEVR